MLELTRRGFIKLGVSAAGLATIGIKFTEEPTKNWITDSGDFYTVVVPDGKILAGERFDKPVLLILGDYSVAKQLEVDGFVNIHSKNKGVGRLEDSHISLEKFDPAVKSMGALTLSTAGVHVKGCSLKTFGKVDIGICCPVDLLRYPSNSYIYTN